MLIPYRLLLLTLCGLLAPHIVFGQQAIRWELQPGDRYRWVTSQDVDLAAEVNGQSVAMSHRTVVQLTWRVVPDDAAHGGRLVRQSVERVQVRLQSPGADELKYDTTDPAPPTTEAARQLAAAVAPLMSAKAEFRVFPDARVADVRLTDRPERPNDPESPAAATFARFLTREGALELSGVAHFALPPQPVSKGDRWERTREVRTAAGPFQRKTVFELTGEEQHDGRRLARISFTWKLEPRADPEPALPGEREPPPPPTTRIERQENRGVIWFDVPRGRPVEAAVEQRLTFVSSTGDKQVRQQTASEMKVRITKLPPEVDGAAR